MNGSASAGKPAQIALGAAGLVLLFSLGYGISLRRLRALSAR